MTASTHDPRREVEKLRDHLASHDKPVAFLVGAGASAAVRDPNGDPLVPTIATLGELASAAISALGQPFETAWNQLRDEIDLLRPWNIEEALSAIRRKIVAVGPADTLMGLGLSDLKKIEQAIQATIATAALPDEARIPTELPHHALGRWIRRTDRASAVEIFTTNYDTLIERSLEDERVAVFDGFVGSRRPFFSPQSLAHEALAPGRHWTRLWKVHGSVNWSWQDAQDGMRIVRGAETRSGELILPSFHKYDESRKQPYSAMLERLRRVLTDRNDCVLITLGYSFGDDHINEVIFDALDLHDRTHVFALQFSDLPDDHVLLTRAKGRTNLVVYGRRKAVVGGVVAPWRLLEPVDNATADLLDIPFDTDGEPEKGAVAMSGEFRLGDFVWFARFLDAIVGGDA